MLSARLALCSVPTSEVLALTEELAALGGSDHAVGSCWVGAVAADGDTAAAAAAAAELDAICIGADRLNDALEQELWPWLRGGYSASVVLLPGDAAVSNAAADSGGSTAGLAGWDVLARVGAAALREGWQLGLSWQLVSANHDVADPLGEPPPPLPQPKAAPKRRPAPAPGQRPNSRLRIESVVAVEERRWQPCTVHITSASELAQALAAAQQQSAQQLSTTAAAAAGSPQLPSLVLRFEMQGAGPGPGLGGRQQQAAVLQVLHLAADSSSSSSSPEQAGLASRRGGSQQQQPPAAPACSHWEGVLKLAGEVADLHQQRREGDHLLASAKLSPLNQLVAPLFAGSSRLFVAAALHGLGSSSGGGGSSSGHERHQQQQTKQLLPLLTALRHVLAVCSKGSAADGNVAANTWVPAEQFVQRLGQRQQAERQRQAEAAALAAAETSRRDKLRAAAQERQQQGPGDALPARHAAVAKREGQHDGQAEEMQQAAEQAGAASAYQAEVYCSPVKHAQQPGVQQPVAQQATLPAPQQQEAMGASTAAASCAAETQPVDQHAGPTSGLAACQGQAQGQVVAAPAGSGSSPGSASGLASVQGSAADLAASSSSSLQQLRQQFHSLLAAVEAPVHPAAAPGSPSAKGQHGEQPSLAPEQITGLKVSRGAPHLQPQPQHPPQQKAQLHRTIAAGVAAADDVATHAAALRMQAAVEARRALQAQRELLSPSPDGSEDARLPAGSTMPAAGAAAHGSLSSLGGEAADGRGEAAFTWVGRSGSRGSSRPGSSGLGQRLEGDLLQLQHHAAEQVAWAAAGQVSTPSRASVSTDLTGADLASLADVEVEAPSIAALYRGGVPASRWQAGSISQRTSWSSAPGRPEQRQQHWQWHEGTGAWSGSGASSEVGWQAAAAGAGADEAAAEAAAAAAALQGWPSAADLSPEPGGTDVSDLFQSDRMPLFTPPGAAAAARAAAAGGRAAGAGAAAGLPAGTSRLGGWSDVQHGGGTCSSSPPGVYHERQQAAAQQQEQAAAQSRQAAQQQGTAQRRQQSPAQQKQPSAAVSDGSRSYAASSQRRQPPAGPSYSDMSEPLSPAAMASPFAATAAAAAAEWGASPLGRTPASSSCQHECPQQHLSPGAAALGRGGEQDMAAVGADVACLLEELQKEQRVNTALLQQLHEVQQALEEALAAAAAAAQPPLSAGVEDPADFNALLAALQRERQQHAALRGQLLLQQQQAEERKLALEARMHTLHRQLLVASAKCRAWEQQSPMAALFRRYEEELQRQQAEGQRLEEENRDLAALLAESDLERLAGASAQLPDDSAVAALCREHQRKLGQAQAQVKRLQEQHASLQKEVQAAQRRDRLAELCRRQAESGQRVAAELRQQLAAREGQLEAQSLAAAEAAAEAAHLRERLQQMELELGHALADGAELSNAVASLRQQVGLLREQGSRERILKRMQLPVPG